MLLSLFQYGSPSRSRTNPLCSFGRQLLQLCGRLYSCVWLRSPGNFTVFLLLYRHLHFPWISHLCIHCNMCIDVLQVVVDDLGGVSSNVYLVQSFLCLGRPETQMPGCSLINVRSYVLCSRPSVAVMNLTWL